MPDMVAPGRQVCYIYPMVTPVRLENIEAFRKALYNYQLSEHAHTVLRESRLVVLSGVAGGGRNSVINYLVTHHNYFFLISDTTRPPKFRDGYMERDGVNYHFRKESEMLRDIQQGEFVEAEIIHNQQVSGTSVREMQRANDSNRIVVHEMEFGGTRFIASQKPDSSFIGLLPPGYDEWLRRLNAREELHPEEFQNRLSTAEKVLENLLGEPYFKFVVNHTIAQCASEIRQIVEDRTVDAQKQAEARSIAETMLQQVRDHLARS